MRVASLGIGCQVLMALNERNPRAILALSVNTGTQAEDDYLQTRKCLLPHNLILRVLGLTLSCLYTEAREPLCYSSPDKQDPLFPSPSSLSFSSPLRTPPHPALLPLPQVIHRIPHTPAQMGSIRGCLAFSLSLLQMIDFPSLRVICWRIPRIGKEKKNVL